MKALLLAVAFMLELIAFAAFASFPFVFHGNTALRILISILLFTLLIAFWSMFMAPRAAKKFSLFPYYCTKLIIYSVSAYVLVNLLSTGAGLVFIVACVMDEALLYSHNTAK